MHVYQDVWVDGKVKQKGIRECEKRYSPIYEHCKKYSRKRSFTVLDIGACLGYFSFRLVSELPAISVMFECNPDYINALAGPLQKDNLLSGLIRQQYRKNRLVLMNRRLSLGDLRELAKCEHFDVVLALRVVHHFKEPFADVIDAIVSLGNYTFLELPTDKEPKVRARKRVCQELADHSAVLEKYNYKLVAETQSHVGPGLSPMYLIRNPNTNKVVKPYWGSRRRLKHTIKSTFSEKTIVKKEKHRDRGALRKKWVSGINLYTYHKLGGIWPSRKDVSVMLRGYKLPKNSPLTDIAMWNFIVWGGAVKLIDHDSINNSGGKPFPRKSAQAQLTKVANKILRGR